ncbi:hypothetical protein HYC85_027258 [Camellia sinensis]|uniref:Uncharacterized protein n=1 Tax=Camellia sinensis TaxID=4442 RepID=A0A7J7G5Z2_CAMSI|nr:hypothetical protein HYC85_027258 [Camellia sinensis]
MYLKDEVVVDIDDLVVGFGSHCVAVDRSRRSDLGLGLKSDSDLDFLLGFGRGTGGGEGGGSSTI